MSNKTLDQLIAEENVRHLSALSKIIAQEKESHAKEKEVRVNIFDMYKNNRIGTSDILVMGGGYEYVFIGLLPSKFLVTLRLAEFHNVKNDNAIYIEVPHDFEVY